MNNFDNLQDKEVFERVFMQLNNYIRNESRRPISNLPKKLTDIIFNLFKLDIIDNDYKIISKPYTPKDSKIILIKLNTRNPLEFKSLNCLLDDINTLVLLIPECVEELALEDSNVLYRTCSKITDYLYDILNIKHVYPYSNIKQVIPTTFVLIEAIKYINYLYGDDYNTVMDIMKKMIIKDEEKIKQSLDITLSFVDLVIDNDEGFLYRELFDNLNIFKFLKI